MAHTLTSTSACRGLMSALSRPAAAVVVAASALAMLGCPPSGEKAGEKKAIPSAPAACTKVGDSCEYSPGKLGSCVQRDECAAPPCFVCQSQH